MKQVGAFYAKTHLSALLQEVEKGETIEITRRGKPIAHFSPINPNAEAEQRRERAAKAVEYFRSLPRKPLPDGMTYEDLINEGRRY